MSQFFTWGSQSFGVSASASVLPMNIQDWFRLGLTGLMSLQSKRLSKVFSNTTIQKHQLQHNYTIEIIPLEKEMATHSTILAWKIPQTEEPGGAIIHEVTKSQTWLNMLVYHWGMGNSERKWGDPCWGRVWGMKQVGQGSGFLRKQHWREKSEGIEAASIDLHGRRWVEGSMGGTEPLGFILLCFPTFHTTGHTFSTSLLE